MLLPNEAVAELAKHATRRRYVAVFIFKERVGRILAESRRSDGPYFLPL